MYYIHTHTHNNIYIYIYLFIHTHTHTHTHTTTQIHPIKDFWELVAGWCSITWHPQVTSAHKSHVSFGFPCIHLEGREGGEGWSGVIGVPLLEGGEREESVPPRGVVGRCLVDEGEWGGGGRGALSAAWEEASCIWSLWVMFVLGFSISTCMYLNVYLYYIIYHYLCVFGVCALRTHTWVYAHVSTRQSNPRKQSQIKKY
jgi:hypothetical protein